MSAEIVQFEDAAAEFERDKQVFNLRLRGLSFAKIAAELNIPVHKAQASAIRTAGGVPPDLRARAAQLDLERLDDLTRPFYEKALDGNVEAVKVILLIMDRRARLLGLDATASRGDSPLDPVTVRETTTEQVEAVLRRLTGKTTVIDGEVVPNQVVVVDAETEVAKEGDNDGG